LDGLLVGVSLAGLFQFFPKTRAWLTRRGNLLLLVGAGLITGAWFFCSDQYSFHASVFGFPLVAIATLSYSIYLTHKGVIHLSQQLFTKWGIAEDSTGMFFLCIVMSILGALVLRYIVERPFLRLRDLILQKRKASREQSLVKMRA
jgi:peptidoglycan/LPS O-acetylase OafA/YrhL